MDELIMKLLSRKLNL